MFFTSLLAASTLASQAAAFLIPLEVAKDAYPAKDLHLSLLNPKSESVRLHCPGCYFDTDNDRQEEYAAQPDNYLALNFTIDDIDNTLSLNGQYIYPLKFPFPLDLYAPLVREANSVESAPIHLGFALEYLPFQEAADQQGTIVPVHLSIIDLAGAPIKVPTVVIDLIKLPTQELMIAKIDSIAFEETPGQECTTSLCRAKAIIMTSLRNMMETARAHAHKAGKMMGMKGKGCGRMSAHKKPGHKVRPFHHHEEGEEMRPHHHQEEGEDMPPFPHHHHQEGEDMPPFPPRPHGLEGEEMPPHHHHHHAEGEETGHRRPHGFGHHGHRHHSRLHRLAHDIVHLFVIPALLGVVGGLIASAIGMVVGQAIVYLWVRLVRGGHRGNASSVRATEIGVEEEKEGLVGEESDDDLPPYEEPEVVVVVHEEKN